MFLFEALHKCFFLSFSSPSLPSMWVNVPANPWWTVETFGMLIFPWAVLSHREKACYYATSKYNPAGGIGWSVNTQHPHSPSMPSMHLKSATAYHVHHQLDIRYLPWLCDFGHLMSAVTFTMHCLSNACTVASVVFCILSFFPLPSFTASPLFTPSYSWKGCRIALNWPNL